MDPTSLDDFDPNQYYRIINLGLGPQLSLDVNTPPDGSLSLSSTGPYLGQLWQFLNTSNAPGHFYVSSSSLGAKKKLDVLANERGDFSPHLRDYAEDYTQTWRLTSQLEPAEENRTTWTITPDFIGTGFVDAEGVFSVYNDTNVPYLAPLASDDRRQRWSVMLEGVPVDDPSFSATHLPALATEAATVPDGQETAPASATTSATTSAAATPTNQVSTDVHDDQVRGSLVVATVLPTTFIALVVFAFCLYIYTRRRKLRRLALNRPYSAPQHCASHCGTHESTSALSQVLDTFVEKPIDTLHRQVTAQKPPRGELTSLSLSSSNMSTPLWSFRNPQESSASVYWNPLSAPPRARLSRNESGAVEADGFMPAQFPSPEQAKSSTTNVVEGEMAAPPEIPAKNARERRKAARRARLNTATALRASRPSPDEDIPE